MLSDKSSTDSFMFISWHKFFCQCVHVTVNMTTFNIEDYYGLEYKDLKCGFMEIYDTIPNGTIRSQELEQVQRG